MLGINKRSNNQRDYLREVLTGADESALEQKRRNNGANSNNLIDTKLNYLLDLITDEIGLEIDSEDYDLAGILITSDEALAVIKDILTIKIAYAKSAELAGISSI